MINRATLMIILIQKCMKKDVSLYFAQKSFHVETKTIFIVLSITFLCQVLNFLGCPILHFMMAISDYLVKG